MPATQLHATASRANTPPRQPPPPHTCSPTHSPTDQALRAGYLAFPPQSPPPQFLHTLTPAPSLHTCAAAPAPPSPAQQPLHLPPSPAEQTLHLRLACQHSGTQGATATQPSNFFLGLGQPQASAAGGGGQHRQHVRQGQGGAGGKYIINMPPPHTPCLAPPPTQHLARPPFHPAPPPPPPPSQLALQVLQLVPQHTLFTEPARLSSHTLRLCVCGGVDRDTIRLCVCVGGGEQRGGRIRGSGPMAVWENRAHTISCYCLAPLTNHQQTNDSCRPAAYSHSTYPNKQTNNDRCRTAAYNNQPTNQLNKDRLHPLYPSNLRQLQDCVSHPLYPSAPAPAA